jgi:hypothetical protein
VSTVGFKTIRIWVGWVPIYIKPSVDICLGLDGTVSAAVTAGVSEQFSARAGVEYSSSAGWRPIQESTFYFGADPPTVVGSFNFKAYGGPKLSLLIYDVAGPYVFGRAYLELKPNWTRSVVTLYGGLELWRASA